MNDFIINRNVLSTSVPLAQVAHEAGKVGDGSDTYELVLDNSKLLANCFEYEPCFPVLLRAAGALGDQGTGTYTDFHEGDAVTTSAIDTPYTVLKGPIYLHLLMQVIIADGTGFTGHGEIFINTASDGDSSTEIAGFSDGSSSGLGFVLPNDLVLNQSGEVVIELDLTAWSPTTESQVISAIYAGAYLQFNDWVQDSGSGTSPTFRVYEAWIEKTCGSL